MEDAVHEKLPNFPTKVPDMEVSKRMVKMVEKETASPIPRTSRFNLSMIFCQSNSTIVLGLDGPLRR